MELRFVRFVLILSIFFFSLASVSAIEFSDNYYVQDPNSCPNGPVSGASCPSGFAFCGGDKNKCYNTTKLTSDSLDPVDNSTSHGGSYSIKDGSIGSNEGGFVTNCLSTSSSDSPYCTDDEEYICHTIDDCDSLDRQTRCFAGKFAYESNSAECSAKCRNDYAACNGLNNQKSLSVGDGKSCNIEIDVDGIQGEQNTVYNSSLCNAKCESGYASCSNVNTTSAINDGNGCEVNVGNTQVYNDNKTYLNDTNPTSGDNEGDSSTGHKGAVYLDDSCGIGCPTEGDGDEWIDTNGDLTDGCEVLEDASCTTGGAQGTIASDGTCVPEKTNFTTGEKATYLTNGSQEAMLWFQNVNATADLVNITNAIGESWRINNNSCIVLKDNTTICDKSDIGSNSSKWNLSGSDLYPENTSYNLGIGTDSVTDTLTVNGTANITGNVTSEKDFCIQGGKCLSETGSGSGDITAVLTGNTPYLYNGSTSGSISLNFNETYLNNTIDVSVNNSAFTSVTGDYLINNSGTLDFNETELNNAIDSRSSGGSGNSVWNLSGVRVYPENTNYNVSIGTNKTYGNRLQVNGSINASGNVTAENFVDSDGNVISGSGDVSSNETFNFVTGFTKDKYDGSITNGSLEGYEAANAICNHEFSGSHFCTTGEILKTNVVNKSISGYAWIANGPPGYTAPANDCEGWTKTSGEIGPYWDYGEGTGVGAGKLATCGSEFRIACCG